MFKKIKHFCLKKFKHLSSEEINVLEWRKKGIKIGNNCHIYSTLPTTRDCFLLTIGNDVTISGKCVFLLHDSSINYPSGGKFTDLLGEIKIGNNCFIGYSSIILPGVTLADGIIVGAGSVVTKSFDHRDCIIAGNPARIISDIKSFFEKNKSKGVNLNGLSQEEIQELIKSSEGTQLVVR